MTGIWEAVAGGIVAGWALSRLPWVPVWLGYVLGLLLFGVGSLLGLQVAGIYVATFEPFGVVLPAVCLASTLRRVGVLNYPQITPWEKLGIAALLTFVVLGTLGLIAPNPYALFYTGLAPALLALSVGAWAALRAQPHILVAVLLAQVLWLLDIGSSNLYDHLTHVLLIPALVVSAGLQGIRGLAETP